MNHCERRLPASLNFGSLSRRWVRIIPVAIVMYTISFIDRTNISLALPHISHDLHLDPQQAGAVAGIFYWGYWVLQIPGGHLAKHWSAKKLVSILMVAWGIAAVGCGLARNGHELLIMRVILGVAEGGVFPATLILLSHWFSRAERARANAFWLLCLPGAVIISSPISGWILDHFNWRVMLMTEGALPLIWLLVWLIFIDDHPQHVSWLEPCDREQLILTLQEEGSELETSGRVFYFRELLRPQVGILAATYFCFTSGQMGLLFWLPSAMERVTKLSNLSTGILFTMPFIVGAVSLLIFSRLSDKFRERRRHVAWALLIGGACLLVAVIVSSRSPVLAFSFIALSGIGAYGPMGPFWAIPTETLPARVVGSAMGLVNGVGNLGGFFAPMVVGYLNKKTGSFLYGFAFLGLVTWISAALALSLHRTKPSKLLLPKGL
jgi:sugar phosphate permease